MRPINNSVFVRQILRNEKASENSLLYIPTTVQAKSNEAEVVAVGPGEWQNGFQIPIPLVKGDRVLFLRFGYTVLINGETLFCCTDRDILAVLDDDDVAEFTGERIDEAERKELLGKDGF